MTTPSLSEHPDVSALSFENALKELEAIVKRMETGEAELEHAITDYARGMALKTHCEKKLTDARMKVDKIVQTEEGSATAAFDAE